MQFIVKDKKDEVRPGMFAVVKLVTDKKALVLPADGVLHVGDNDYALKGADDGTWQIIQVRVGELRRRPTTKSLTGCRKAIASWARARSC